jgi:hypothetical protein
VLRDPEDIAPYKEVGIGPITIEEVHESPQNLDNFKRRLHETEKALSSYLGRPADAEPQVILTHDCFGFEGPVRLLIYSNKPFSSGNDRGR